MDANNSSKEVVSTSRDAVFLQGTYFLITKVLYENLKIIKQIIISNSIFYKILCITYT